MPMQELNEEEQAEQIAEELTKLGLTAYAQDTGGGTICVAVEHKDGGEILWGTADITWGAVITDEDGEQVSAISTQWPSDSQDISGTAQTLAEASSRNGATSVEA